MTEAEFAFLRDLLLKRSGLSLSTDKRYLVESRLSVVCRQKGLRSLSDLVQKLRGGQSDLTTAVVEAMTTNETLFFRDNTPFQHFRDVMLPAIIKARAAERTIRIWCAAASSGQEPYSLAMVLDEFASTLQGWRVEIVATDISSEIVEKARLGVYSQFEIQRGLPIQLLLKHFTQEGERWRISDRLRRLVTFRQHNLINPQGNLGIFDVIFCRNVLIYFDVPTKGRVLDLLRKHIASDGFLSLGAAETVMGVSNSFTIDRERRGVYLPAPAPAPARPRPAASSSLGPGTAMPSGVSATGLPPAPRPPHFAVVGAAPRPR